MIYYHDEWEAICSCKKCGHVGIVTVVGKEKDIALRLVCSKCGAKTFVIKPLRNKYESRYYDDEGSSDYWIKEETPEEEGRKMALIMMAPTGWEDDEELQEYMGID